MQDNDNQDATIVDVLLRISKLTRTVIGLRLAEVGLTTGEDDILLALDGQTPMNLMELSLKISVRSATTIVAIDRLASLGYVENLGRNLVRLTETGVEVRSRVIGIRRRIQNDIAQGVDLDRLASLTGGLEELAKSLDRALTRLT